MSHLKVIPSEVKAPDVKGPGERRVCDADEHERARCQPRRRRCGEHERLGRNGSTARKERTARKKMFLFWRRK